MVFGKKKLDEKKIMAWVNKKLEGGDDMEQISNVLMKKYPKKEIEEFLKKNYSIEPEVKDKKLEKGLEEEKKKKQEEDELDAEMDALKEEAGGEEVVTPEDVPGGEPEAPVAPKGKEEPKEIPIDDMSTYKIESIKLLGGIYQGIQELIKLKK